MADVTERCEICEWSGQPPQGWNAADYVRKVERIPPGVALDYADLESTRRVYLDHLGASYPALVGHFLCSPCQRFFMKEAGKDERARRTALERLSSGRIPWREE